MTNSKYIRILAFTCSLAMIGGAVRACNEPDLPTLSDSTESCLTAVQKAVGENEIIIVHDNFKAVNGDLRGTFQTLGGKVFAFECRLSDNHIYYVVPKAKRVKKPRKIKISDCCNDRDNYGLPRFPSDQKKCAGHV